MASLKEALAQPEIQQAVERHASQDMAEPQEKGLLAKVAEMLPIQEVKEELGNRVEEAQSGIGRFLSEIGQEIKEQAKMGSHELAAALLRGQDGFVMYQREDGGDKGHGLPPEALKDRGMEMEM